jgi:hypothetical protein
MRRTLICSSLLLFSVFLLAENQTKKTSGIDFNSGVGFSFNIIDCQIGDAAIANKLTFLYPTLNFNLDVMEYLTVGVFVGYNFAHMNQAVDFVQLPLSIELNQTKFQGLLFGARLQSQPFSIGDFSLKAAGEFLIAREGGKNWDITLPLVKGTATGKNQFSLTTVDLLLQYEGYSGVTLFAGPRLNLLNGKMTVTETIESIEGSQELTFKQKNLIGPTAGASFELGSNWEVIIRGSLVSRLSASLEISYSR